MSEKSVPVKRKSFIGQIKSIFKSPSSSPRKPSKESPLSAPLSPKSTDEDIIGSDKEVTFNLDNPAPKDSLHELNTSTKDLLSNETKYGLHILKIECSDLDSVGMLKSKANDVCCVLNWCESKYQNKVLTSAGSNALFEDADMYIKSLSTVSAESLKVTIMDKMPLLPGTVIGTADVSLLPATATNGDDIADDQDI